MNRRAVLAGTGVVVVLSAVSGALINELRGGWPWWVASAAVVAAAAGLSMWLVARQSPPAGGPPTSQPTGNPRWSGEVHQDVRLEGQARGYTLGQGEMHINDR